MTFCNVVVAVENQEISPSSWKFSMQYNATCLCFFLRFVMANNNGPSVCCDREGEDGQQEIVNGYRIFEPRGFGIDHLCDLNKHWLRHQIKYQEHRHSLGFQKQRQDWIGRDTIVRKIGEKVTEFGCQGQAVDALRQFGTPDFKHGW